MRRECARLVAEEAAAKKAAEVVRRQELLKNSMHVKEQVRLKKLVAKAEQEGIKMNDEFALINLT